MRRHLSGSSKSDSDTTAVNQIEDSKEKAGGAQSDVENEKEIKQGVIVALVLGFFVFAVYIKTAFPTVASGDSGELCFTSCSLGVAHPPGYPLFIMVGFLFTKIIPIGSPAFRVNCVSCCCGAAAGGNLILQLLIGSELHCFR